MPPVRRKPLPTVLAAALSSLVPLAACVSGDAGGGPATAFEGARLIAGDGGAPVDDAVLVVRDGRIVAAGPRDEVAVPDGAATVDLTGKTVMPALVNAHMHLPSAREERTEQLLHNAYYGATAVVSLGLDSGEVALRMRDERIPGGPERSPPARASPARSRAAPRCRTGSTTRRARGPRCASSPPRGWTW